MRQPSSTIQSLPIVAIVTTMGACAFTTEPEPRPAVTGDWVWVGDVTDLANIHNPVSWEVRIRLSLVENPNRSISGDAVVNGERVDVTGNYFVTGQREARDHVEFVLRAVSSGTVHVQFEGYIGIDRLIGRLTVAGLAQQAGFRKCPLSYGDRAAECP